jgi:quinohemoprotein amine dehydrogenase beta subunit
MNIPVWAGGALLAISLLLGACSEEAAEPTSPVSAAPQTRDYMVTVSRPNNLNLIDLYDNTLVKQCELPGRAAPGTLVVSPDRTIAYVLADGFGDVYGIALDSCELVFSTNQSQEDIRVKSIGSIAISPDGVEIYTHQNRVQLLRDRYELQAPQIAVFDTSAGLDTQPVRTFDGPRQVTIMATDAKGALYLGGPDLYRMDVATGEYEIALASRSVEDPAYSQRDILSVWPLGEVNDELIRMYTAARYRGDSGDLDNADWIWGYELVDLKTGETEDRVFGPLEVALFTGMRRPGHLDKMYAVLTQLKEYDVASQSVTRSIELEHTYYCINFSTDGSRLYLSGALSDVAVYDADSLEKITNIQLSGDMGLANSYVFNRRTL